jgi:hypothetical protein
LSGGGDGRIGRQRLGPSRSLRGSGVIEGVRGRKAFKPSGSAIDFVRSGRGAVFDSASLGGLHCSVLQSGKDPVATGFHFANIRTSGQPRFRVAKHNMKSFAACRFRFFLRSRRQSPIIAVFERHRSRSILHPSQTRSQHLLVISQAPESNSSNVVRNEFRTTADRQIDLKSVPSDRDGAVEIVFQVGPTSKSK